MFIVSGTQCSGFDLVIRRGGGGGIFLAELYSFVC